MLPFPPATGSKQQAFPSRYRDFAETSKLHALGQNTQKKEINVKCIIKMPLVRGFVCLQLSIYGKIDQHHGKITTTRWKLAGK